ncbi:hypothetical protein BC936DRAFT_143320 [Jimgerdemannia flammicorona]|uniref:OCEL domain-containing protein n=1 Tax=Jimgerdemannia flammicorona TaxID=994334 RepID=A0A432ZZ46_9FUNG|nr:hypothetical protein BC936DRAFT_143320 [Jimgerdemannia flammicorona]
MEYESWSLKPEFYKDVQIWSWRHYEPSERQQVIKNAKGAYEKLNYPDNAKERANLIQPDKPKMNFPSLPKKAEVAEPRPIKRAKVDTSTDSGTDAKKVTKKKKAVAPGRSTQAVASKRASAVGSAAEGSRSASGKSTAATAAATAATVAVVSASSTSTARLKSTNGKTKPPSASLLNDHILVAATGVNGTTPNSAGKRAQGPSFDDLLTSATQGTAVMNSVKEAEGNHVHSGSKRKNRDAEEGAGAATATVAGAGTAAAVGTAVAVGTAAAGAAGAGAGAGAGEGGKSGYKIPKRGAAGVGLGGARGATEKEDVWDPIDLSKPYIPPHITTLSEYNKLCRQFNDKYDEYRKLDASLGRHKEFLEALRDVDRMQRPGTADASAAKRKYEEFGGREGRWGEVMRTAERYVRLHRELEGIKSEVWRAYNQGIGGANGAVPGAGAGAGT